MKFCGAGNLICGSCFKRRRSYCGKQLLGFCQQMQSSTQMNWGNQRWSLVSSSYSRVRTKRSEGSEKCRRSDHQLRVFLKVLSDQQGFSCLSQWSSTKQNHYLWERDQLCTVDPRLYSLSSCWLFMYVWGPNITKVKKKTAEVFCSFRISA